MSSAPKTPQQENAPPLPQAASRHKRRPRLFVKLALAGLVSGAGFAGTYLWHMHTTPPDTPSGAKPIARVSYFNNEVERKLKTKFIWQAVSGDTQLGTGESIRTGSGSEARIEFLGTGTVVDLEQDSLIVIEESAGKVALDFLAGNLFVKGQAGGDNASDITLKSGDSSIALQGAELSLGKEKSGELNLQVFNGSATVQASGQTTAVGKNQQALLSAKGVQSQVASLEAIAPLPTSPVYLNVTSPKPVRFQWRPITGAYDVQLETGSSRSDLKPVANVSASSDAGALEAPIKIGTTYWRLKAIPRSDSTEQAPLQSSIFKLQVLPQSPPVALKPVKDQSVRLKPDESSLSFAWTNPARLATVRLEVSKRPDLKEKIFDQVLEGATSSIDVKLKDAGTYYWRLSGPSPESKPEKPIYLAGDVQKFTVQTTSEIMPPTLKAPLANGRIPLETVKENGVLLSWEIVPDAIAYRVTITHSGSKPVVKEVPANQIAWREVQAGEFDWHVESKDATGLFSKTSEVRKFRLDDIQTLQWLGKTEPEPILFVTEKPLLSVSWEKGSEAIRTWNLKLLPVGDAEAASKTPVEKPVTNEFKSELAKEGTYSVEVEGLSAEGVVLARTNKRTLTFKKLPPPEAPQFEASLPKEIEASRSGRAEITWKPVERANSYLLQIRTPEGAVVKELKVTETKSVLTGLMPGDYRLSLYANDQHGRRSPASEIRALRVPVVNALGKPKVKQVKIK